MTLRHTVGLCARGRMIILTIRDVLAQNRVINRMFGVAA
jgi:hypothetical protein